ncbi:MAG TPA: VCBS repeat-containing protein, partial [Chitinophagaceae bacterium]|nr:VCBS repeat-containing protein [Chitinophagaceae bacterium]
MHNDRRIFVSFLLLAVIFFAGCKSRKTENALFEVLKSNSTGLDFANKLTYTKEFNLFNYMYFYNGAGVGAGDFNNDGLIDLFFSANQTDEKLYLNKGNHQFSDVTKEAMIPQSDDWTTGVSVVDVNNDGLLDIYICTVGKFEYLTGENQLLICTGIDKNKVPHYENKAGEYGVNFSGFSTMSAFLDYDMDGDLDMFLLNHSIHQNGTFGERKNFEGTYSAVSGDRIYRNDGKTFTDVTRETGINSSAIGYGLGVVVADINIDGYPDLYIGNDFHENDYLYINQRDGTFKEELDKHMMHTSQYTMGVDVADMNNDGFPDVVSMDMLPSDPYILKRSLGEDEFDLYFRKIGYGYNYQYTRNNLQINRRNGMFSEIGLFSGVAATDWSWATLFMDFDNDGQKDLFVSNGIPKRMNDMDYINYISNKQVQENLNNKNPEGGKDLSLINKFPEIKIPNKFFRNTGQLAFADMEDQIEGNVPNFSNGAVYADLNNDGDLDIVVSNIDEPVIVYENKTNDDKNTRFIELKLKGPSTNVNAIGAKVYLFSKGDLFSYEKYPVHGFLSSMEIPMHIGLNNIQPDSIFMVWPDNTFQKLADSSNGRIELSYKQGLGKFNYSIITEHIQNTSRKVEDLTAEVGLNYRHKENQFPEFDREFLLPHMLSTEGPALAVADINKDGLDDVFIGASRWGKSVVFMQNGAGKFQRSLQPALDMDSVFEDVAATWTDVNNDGSVDLVIASGGNEFYGEDPNLSPRVYLNDGKGRLARKPGAFIDMFETFSSVVPIDFDDDGDMDLFIGARAIPFQYGAIPKSYFLQNDGTGKFSDVSGSVAKDLSSMGFVTSATAFDIDKDGNKDILVTLEWGEIIALMKSGKTFTRKVLTDKKGWWNFVYPCDVDQDGDIDLIAGNLGLNSRLKASAEQPVRMYYNDFDDNGRKDQVVTYYIGGKEITFATKSELEKQMPFLKKKFLYAENFAKANLKEIFPQKKLDSAAVFTANYFSNSILINNGNLQFETVALPVEAQFTSFKSAIVVNANNDSQPDILVLGNYYENNIEMGRYDADYGTLLINKGNGNFTCSMMNGVSIK